MFKIYKIIFLFFVIFSLVYIPNAYSDEQELFTNVKPDALIVLDTSLSMAWAPPGGNYYITTGSNCSDYTGGFYADSAAGRTKKCTYTYGQGPKYGDATCAGPFYLASDTGHTTNCSRMEIAKRAIFNMLDDNNDSTINSSDDSSLKVRFGYMRFETLIKSIDTSYSRIYCNSSSSCTITSTCTSPSDAKCITRETASGATPLAAALGAAKTQLDAHKADDTAKDCRDKFVIVITDGADTLACSGGSPYEDQSDQYKRRRETVAKAKALADAGYKVFTVGFGGDMPDCLQRTLNWAAYYGGTDNPDVDNSGSTSGYNIPSGSLYPSGVTSCSTASSTSIVNDICGKGGGAGDTVANANDPATASLSGYAFFATNSDELTKALKRAISIIKSATYSFSVSSVSSVRIADENYIYEASFVPVDDEPFWLGHLKKYPVNSDGSLGSIVWDAGEKLKTTSADSRNIYTYKSGELKAFNTTNISASDLGFTSPDDTEANRNKVIGYIRGESAYNPDNWKLGDIFHSNPITIGTPSPFFNDTLDSSNAFSSFRSSHKRGYVDGSDNGLRRIVVGANDGQLHTFKTSDGSEVWSFIPPNFLSRLKDIAHSSHPTGSTHQYLVDGPVTVADVWLGTGSGATKSASDWKTLLVFSEGKGGSTTLWSSSSSCDSGFNSTYSSTYKYYCGYYAFDYTDTSVNPIYKWRINDPIPASTDFLYLGEPWSRMVVGRVKISGNEKWVGFIGGGYNASNCSGGGVCDTKGKGFYVIDLNNGNILWSYTRANTTAMEYSIPASPAIVDTDNDGFIDTAYIGDLGGNIWRLKFCTKSEITAETCTNTSHWSGGLLFDARGGGAGTRPIYNSLTVAKDANSNLWAFWATGDKTDPTTSSTNEIVAGVKDTTRSNSYTKANLNNVTSAVQQCNSSTDNGWYINFTGNEKALSGITVFGGVVYFTTYLPSTSSNACEQTGTSKLYAINYQNCTGMLSGGARSITIGKGIASAPIISLKPGTAVPPDLYVTVSGGDGQDASTTRINFSPPFLSNRTNMLFWKDKRVQ